MSDYEKTGQSAADKLSNAVGNAKDAVSNTASNVSNNVGSALDNAQASASSTLHDAKDAAKGNPIGLLIGGLVAGAVVAAFLPVSETERRKVQPIRDDVVGRVVKAKDDVVKAGRGVLEETVTAASQAVNKHSNELAKELESDFKTTDGTAPTV